MTVLQTRTLKTLGLLLLAYGVLCLPATQWLGYLDSPLGLIAVVAGLAWLMARGITAIGGTTRAKD